LASYGEEPNETAIETGCLCRKLKSGNIGDEDHREQAVM
jgi:hypothetical protein